MRRIRRAAALLAAVVGLGLVALPFTYSMFGRTADAERILDRFEFLALNGNPDRYLQDAVETRAGSSELVEKALPAIAPGAVGVGDGVAVMGAAGFEPATSRV